MENYPSSGVLGHHSHQNLNRGDGDFDMVNGDGLITREETKFGIRPDQTDELIEHAKTLKHVKVCGLMTILPKIDISVSNRLHFVNIMRIYLDISRKKADNITMKYLSMGMSGDFEEAIEEGSNMVRIGRAIFGERNYDQEGNINGKF